MNDEGQHEETWTEWVRRQKADETTATQQFVQEGISFEVALLLAMLGRIHNELVDIAEVLGTQVDALEEGEEWKQEEGGGET